MLLPQLISNQKGHALVLALVAVAGIGTLSLLMMRSSDRTKVSDVRDMQTFDRENLLTDLRMILANENNCRFSVSGDFYKSKISDKDKHQGLPVQVWLSDGTNKTRSILKDGDLYYKLRIQSVRLFMDYGDPTKEMPDGVTSQLGTLRVKYKVEDGGDYVLDLPLRVTARTNASGKSSVLTCQLPVEEKHCEAVNMVYDEASGKCEYLVACMDLNEVADKEEEWSGEVSDKCDDNLGSHLRDIILTQAQIGPNLESNGMITKCCFPRTMYAIKCLDFETTAEAAAWIGNRDAFCNLEKEGQLTGVLFSQLQLATGTEVNGLMIRCCYPFGP